MKTKKQLIRLAADVLAGGGLIVVPSDTIYGLAVDASNEKAVNKLFDFKSRIPGKAISVFVSDFEMAKKYVKISKKNLNILKKILPGPYTAVLPSCHKLVKSLESEKGTLGIRIVKNDFISNLLKKFGRPITATSANMSGQSPHYFVSSFLNSLSEKKKKEIDLIVDFGKLPRRKPSTVIDLTTSKIKILRQGDFKLSEENDYLSGSPDETKKIARLILRKILKSRIFRPLVIILEGELGVGKTIFVKGLGEYLGIYNIISPTFILRYEYEVKNKRIKKLYHLDLYRVEEGEELEDLGFDGMLKSKNLICIEWGEKIGEIFNYIKNNAQIVYVRMEYLSEKQRKIIVKS